MGKAVVVVIPYSPTFGITGRTGFTVESVLSGVEVNLSGLDIAVNLGLLTPYVVSPLNIELSGLDVVVSVGEITVPIEFVDIFGTDIAVSLGNITPSIIASVDIFGLDIDVNTGSILADMFKEPDRSPSVSWFVEIDAERYPISSFALRYYINTKDYLSVDIPFSQTLLTYLKNNTAFTLELKQVVAAVESILWSGSALDVETEQEPKRKMLRLSGRSATETIGNGSYSVQEVENYQTSSEGMKIRALPEHIFKPNEILFLPQKPENTYTVKRVTYNAQANKKNQKYFIEILAA